MKKKIKIPIYTSDIQPEDYTPFSMILGRTWKAYDAGELNSEKVMLMSVLYRNINAYNAEGHTSYAGICILLKKQPTEQNINTVNKMMVELRDEHHLIWFLAHSGSRDFAYVLDMFKIATLGSKGKDKWIDIEAYFRQQSPKESRGIERPPPEPEPEPLQRHAPPEQRSNKTISEMFAGGREILGLPKIRPPQTDTDTQTDTNSINLKIL